VDFWVEVASGYVFPGEEIVAVVDWRTGKHLPANREFLSCARAHDILVEDGKGLARSMLVTRDKVFLLSPNVRTIAKHLSRT